MRDPDVEEQIRNAFGQLPGPSEKATRAARRRVLHTLDDAVPRRRAVPGVRRRGTLALAAALTAFSLLAGFALGRTSAPDPATRAVARALTPTGGPGFVPAAGWNTQQTDGAALYPGGVASAATVDLLDAPRAFPHRTIAALGSDDVLIRASLYGRADFVGPAWDTYPLRTLPLRTPRGDAAASWEGGSGWRYVITGRVQGWLLEVVVYFGAQPTTAVRRLADAELARLLLPSPCPRAQRISANDVASATSAVGRQVVRQVDTSVTPPVDYRDPRLTARRATSADAIPSACRHIPADRVVVVDVRYPHLSDQPRLARRTYLVSRQGGRNIVWARTR